MILDTNALSAAADNDPLVIAMLARADEVALPVIVLGEYRYGIALSRNRKRYEDWLDGLITDSSVLDVTIETTRHYAAINLELRRAGTPIPANDLWIAGLCRQHSLPVISRDGHFDLVSGITRLAW